MAAPPNWTNTDFLAGMQALMPTGPAWPRDADAVQTQVLAALVPVYTGNAGAAAALLVDAFPSTTLGLLPEWEATLGLPDPCTPLNPSMAQRQAAVLAKFISFGGQTTEYYIAVAAALGYPITITELSDYAWQINVPSVNISYFTAGISVAGDPLWTIGNAELECRIKQIMPAHTVLTFNFS